MQYRVVICVERFEVDGPFGDDEPLLRYDHRVVLANREELVDYVRKMAAGGADPALDEYARKVEAAARKVERKGRTGGQ